MRLDGGRRFSRLGLVEPIGRSGSPRSQFGRCKAELGFDLDKEEIDEVYTRFTQLADKKKKIYDQDLIALARRSPVAIAA